LNGSSNGIPTKGGAILGKDVVDYAYSWGTIYTSHGITLVRLSTVGNEYTRTSSLPVILNAILVSLLQYILNCA
jgi:hypothetical protein